MGYKLKRILIYPDGVTEKQVYPYKYNPGSNTLAYYPLTSTTTVNDQSGNNRNLTNNLGVTFGVYKGIDCAYFSGSNYLTQSMGYSGGAVTISGVGYFISYGTYDEGFVRIGGNLGAYVHENDRKILCSPGGIGSTVWTTDTGWKLITVTYDGSGNLKLYINGVLNATNTSANPPTGGNLAIGTLPANTARAWKGGISEVIIENIERSQDYINKYLSSIKDIYGIN